MPMQTSHPERLHHDLGAVLALTRLLERLEPGASEQAAAQYRQVASTLSALLDAAEPDQAGLCRHALGASLNSEIATVELIRRVRTGG